MSWCAPRFEMGVHDETVRVLLVGKDLNAIARIEGAGADVTSIGAPDLQSALADRWDLIVLDLDAGGEGLLDGLASLRERGLIGDRVVGYYSHVAADLGVASREAGVESLPRGRFWRSLPSLLEEA